MGRKSKYRTPEERKMARQTQRLERSLKPGAKEIRRMQNRKAYAKHKVVVVPVPSEAIQTLSAMEISEDSGYEHLCAHYSTIKGPLELPDATLTNANFQNMAGHPPYSSHIINHPSFEKNWELISAAFHGYATRIFVSEQTQWLDEGTNRDRTSLSSELTKQYEHLMAEWETFGIELRELGKDPDTLPSELIVFQN
ncbi:hypothetical protein EST38_g12101 [Candolleomyces aberdarensis]|uniref:Uncharacterized protein n=1 Tax=Candolleomyces aberdarensis TaxID=2316362 RepID=A0A4Q2D5U9_9AGAR|nr:hypothetical protein EST38_g12101 [Candolleomyces aberdarensis]